MRAVERQGDVQASMSCEPLCVSALVLAHDAGVTVLHCPGGAWGDQNDLKSTQIDQLVQLARDMSAEPDIYVRFLDGRLEQAADLVTYPVSQSTVTWSTLSLCTVCYPFPYNASRTPASSDHPRASASTRNEIARRLCQTVREDAGRDIPVAITEVNSHRSCATSGEATPDSFYSAI